MLNLLKQTTAGELFNSCPEVVQDIISAITELSKLYFTKQEGISSLFSKTIVSNLAEVLKRSDQPLAQLSALKSLGIFAAQAGIVPTRCSSFFKDFLDLGVMQMLAGIIKEAAGASAKAKAL